jgi:glycerol uptake facilitator protein
VLIAGPYTGDHLSPAVTLGFAVAGTFPWAHVAGYIVAQMLGAFCGATIVYYYYKDHFDITDDPTTKLGIFCTIPAIENKGRNFFCEVVATMLLIFVILAIGNQENTPEVGMGSLGSFPTATLIMVVGMSLGGTTGYALNPARDLGPRIAHALLPIKGKGTSGWGYSWVPIFGPLVGAVLAALAYMAVYNF